MQIREATAEDGDELQRLQAQCPQGGSLVVSIVNTPDFFARAKACETYKVFVACEDGRIVGSGACALRNGTIGGRVRRIGYEFQFITSPDRRKEGVAARLGRTTGEYLRRHDAELSYALIIGSNRPSTCLAEQQGYRLHRTLVMPTLAVLKDMNAASNGRVRAVRPEDLAQVAELLNATWRGREFYEPTSADSLARFISRTPGFSCENLLVLEEKEQITACLGFWDWRQVMRVTVMSLSRKTGIAGRMLVAAGVLPRFFRPGDRLRQGMLALVGFQEPSGLAVLLRHLNNEARVKGIEQILCLCERTDAMLSSMKGFLRADTRVRLYVKPLRGDAAPSDGPVFVSGIDV